MLATVDLYPSMGRHTADQARHNVPSSRALGLQPILDLFTPSVRRPDLLGQFNGALLVATTVALHRPASVTVDCALVRSVAVEELQLLSFQLNTHKHNNEMLLWNHREHANQEQYSVVICSLTG